MKKILLLLLLIVNFAVCSESTCNPCSCTLSELAAEVQLIMQPSPEILQAIGQERLNTPESFLKHIFAAELREKKLPNDTVKKSLSGFHHYTPAHLDELNIKLINPRTCQKTGLIIADVLCEGHLGPNKTFFPTIWNREKVISKVGEALKDLTDSPLIQGSRGILLGRTSEDIVIKVVVDIEPGNYITAYPDARANGLLPKV